jgi:hypothetical protein
LSTILQTLHQLSLSHKALSKQVAQCDALLQAAWIAEYGSIPKEACIWIDKSGVDQDCSWEFVGCAPIGVNLFVHEDYLTMLSAINYTGIVVFDILAGSVTKERFLSFVSRHLACIH